MKTSTRYSPEVRERAVRMVFEHHARREYAHAPPVSGYLSSRYDRTSIDSLGAKR